MKRKRIIFIVIFVVVLTAGLLLAFHSCENTEQPTTGPTDAVNHTDVDDANDTEIDSKTDSNSNTNNASSDNAMDADNITNTSTDRNNKDNKTNPDILNNKPADKTDVDEPEVDVDDPKQDTKPSGPNSSTATGSGTNKPSAGDSTGGSGSSGSGSSSTGGGSSGSSGGHWETVTKQVWVVDVPAQTIEEPVYEEKYVSICNRCGAVLITQDELDSHMKDHMLKGEYENCSWHNDYRTIQVGTKTVEVPEQGHWETRVVE